MTCLPETLSTHFIGPLPPLPSLVGYSNPGAPYTVGYGWCRENHEKFASFVDALRFYAEKNGGAFGADITGDGYDCDCDQDGYFCCDDGLTDLEREWVEAVDAGEEIPGA